MKIKINTFSSTWVNKNIECQNTELFHGTQSLAPVHLYGNKTKIMLLYTTQRKACNVHQCTMQQTTGIHQWNQSFQHRNKTLYFDSLLFEWQIISVKEEIEFTKNYRDELGQDIMNIYVCNVHFYELMEKLLKFGLKEN